MSDRLSNPKSVPARHESALKDLPARTYWRVEGSLLEVGAMRPVGFFTWNAQSFAERWARRAGMGIMALTRPFAYAASRTFATRALHTLLRGVSQDRMDLLGEEYFHYVLKPALRPEATEKLLEAVRKGEQIVLVGQLLDHILRPLASHFGIELFISNRMEFRDGHATGRLLSPVVRPRGPFAWIAGGSLDGRIPEKKLLQQLGWSKTPQRLESALQSSAHPAGLTGFIGKVWLVDLLENVSTVGKITLLIRRNRTTSAQRRFEKIVEESPTFDGLQERYGRRLGAFLKEKVEVVEGDVSQPGLGMDESTQARLAKSLDLIVNSAGLTDFNPDLREALASNVDSTLHLLGFLRKCDRAGLMHLSTCYVVGMRDGRVDEELHDNYNPANDADFDAEREIDSLREMIGRVEERSQGPELTKALRRQALGRGGDP